MIKFTEIQKSRYKRLLALVKDSWARLALAMVCLVVGAGTQSVTALLVKPILDDIFTGHDETMLMLVPVAVVVVFFLKGLADYGDSYFMNHVGLGIIRRLRNQIYGNMMGLSLSYFQSETTGALMSRITNDVALIKNMVSNAVTRIFRDIFTIAGLVGVIFYRDWKMALLAMVFLPLFFYPIFIFGRRVRKVSTGCQEAIADISSFIHETITGNKVVKAFGMENYERERFFKKSKRLFQLQMKQVVAKELSSPIMETIAGLGIAFIIWFGGSRVMSGTSTTGTFFSFMTAVLMLYGPVKKLKNFNNTIQEGLAAVDRVYDVIDSVPEIEDKKDAKVMKTGPHRMTFRDVSFGYKTAESGKLALSGVNIDVAPGEILALVGMSGGGKTSLVNLIPRFFDVTEGAILMDGTDIRDLTIESLRRQISIVTQEPILFNDTIRGNIAYGRIDATDKEIEAAAKAAYAHDFIMRMPKGYDTPVGELGGRLSGGEKQRLCIARALIKDAPVLILDEATSALDAEAELLVQKALENLMKGRTTFVIAHRLATIGYADRIVVLVGGRIVEEGSHDELMALDGEYGKLHNMQFAANA